MSKSSRTQRSAKNAFSCLKAGFIATLNFPKLATYAQFTGDGIPLAPTLVTSGITSADLVGSAEQSYVKYPKDPEDSLYLIDFIFITPSRFQKPYPSTDPFDKCWWLRWAQPVQIRSFSAILGSNGNHIDVYVTSTLPFSVGDQRLLCKSNVWPDGAFNCGHTLTGTYFVMQILDTADEGDFNMHELRVFSTKDLAVSASVVGNVQNIVGPTLPKRQNQFRVSEKVPFYIDLGAEYVISFIRMLFANDVSSINVSIGTNLWVNSPIAYKNSWQRSPTKNNEEWNMNITDDISVRYILFCKTTIDCSTVSIDLRKVQVFGKQTCAINEITVTSTSVYAVISWTGVLTGITWPTFTISPEDCFDIADIQLTDSAGSDLVAAGLFFVDWVTKTITYNSPLGCLGNVTMYTTFNTPTPFKDSGINLHFDCSAYFCSISTIEAQSLGSPLPYQIIYSFPNEVALLEFTMNIDSEGIFRQDPISCGYKTYQTDQTWLQVRAISESDLQNFKLVANTNDITLVGEHLVTLTIGFQNPLYKQTLQQTLTVVVLHPCKKTIITSTQVILEMAYIFGSPALFRPFSAFEDSVQSAYGTPGFCQLTYSLSIAADAERFGVTIETTPSLQIKVHALDQTLLGNNVSLILSANAIPQQETQSTQLTFIVSIQDPCQAAVISSTTITDMNYTVTKSAVRQQFILFTYSLSTATNIPGLCGPIDYFISEAYQFVSVATTSAIGTITVQTNLISDAKTYQATLTAKLSRYSNIAHSKVQFTLTIINPCLATTLALSSTLQLVVISSPGGTENLQTFAPATDQASSDASNPSLCGPKIYSIAETDPTRFVSIVPPAANLDPYSAFWSLKCFSNDNADLGDWTVTLRAQLQLYPEVPAATSTFKVTVLNICLQAEIQPEQLIDMTIYITDTSPRTQTFLPFKDRFNNILSSTGSCGPKKYSISDPLTQIFPPLSNLVDTDPWTISAHTTDINLVGVRTVIVAASFVNYPALPAVIASFKLTVVGVCLDAKISNKDQVLQTMTYVPVIVNSPTLQKFLPFTHDLVLQNGDPKICGPFSYSIVQGYSFIQIINPEGDPYTEKWVLSLKTSRMTDIGSYQATLQASLTNYPSSVPAVLEFMIQIINPCTETKLTLKVLQAMSYTFGTASATTQSFSQIQDDVSTSIGQAKFCGERTYKLIGDLPFLKFTEPQDPWTENFQLDLQTNDKSKVGNYTAVLEVNLVSFALHVPLRIWMSLFILPQPQNKLPHFEPQLESVISIEKTQILKTWSFSLPKIVDLDAADIVSMTVEFGSAKFLTLNGVSSIECADISMSSNVKAGMYQIKLTLDDGRDKVDFQIQMFVYDFKEESAKDEATTATDKTEPSTSENQSAKNETESSESKNLYSFNTYVPPVPQNVLKRNLIAPKATLESISDTGLALLKFSKPMIVPNFLQDIPRRVKEATYIDYTEKVIKVEVIPGILEDFDKLKIGNFTIQEFSELDLLVQVNFESPAYVSLSAIQPDELMISFISREYFIDAVDFLQIEQRQLKRIITPQQSQAQAAQTKVLESVASKSMTVVTTGNLVLNIVLSYGLKYLWNMVNLLQFLVFIQQWKFSLPSNAGGFLKYLKSLALMEFVDTAPITKWMSDKLGLCKQCKAERETQKILGKLKAPKNTVTKSRRQLKDVDITPKSKVEPKSEDGNIIQNLGIIVIMVLGILLALFVVLLLSYVVNYKYSWYKFYANLKRKIFYNTFIRFFLQGALKMQIAFCVTLMADGWTNWIGRQIMLQKLVAVTGLFVFSLIPAVFYYILRRKRTELWRPSVKAQIGSLYLGINSGSAWALSYSIVFMLRRTLFVFLMFSLIKQPAIQMNLLIYSSIFYIIYLQYVRPHDDQSSVLIETINEVILLVICYHFILLTDLLSDPFIKFKIGFSLIICVCVMIAVNLSIIVFVSLRQLYNDFRKKRALRLRAQLQFEKKIVPDVTFKQLEQMAVIEEEDEEDEKSEESEVQIDGEEEEGEQEEYKEKGYKGKKHEQVRSEMQAILNLNKEAYEKREITSPDQSFHSDGIYSPLGMNQISIEDDLASKAIKKRVEEIPDGLTESQYEGFCLLHPQQQAMPQMLSGGDNLLIDDAPTGFNRQIIPKKRLSQSLELPFTDVQQLDPAENKQDLLTQQYMQKYWSGMTYPLHQHHS